ncbi:unnamed protein product [Lactuca virosa]|uniref:Uncharacterized protein n=2 Tax=Lactuca TaxID=4235 RepID=A0AA35Y122_LACSI|nr:unnamed protein product [Lactuca virosa]CAI9261247.1 unnamed protein product [Lactuca saligna]CAH1434120.1 unnamed protein product [Lactuca virosa]CAH1442584.1 unnamed protein product [Lactuca virosa]CAI9262689.1 unnamed protein product [Lactuca saligna]
MLLRCVPDTEKSLPQHEAVVHPKTTIPYVTDRIQESFKVFDLDLNIHDDLLLLLVLVLVFVSRILVRALWHFHYNKCRNSWVPGITWTISTLCCLLDLCSEWLVEHAECAGEEGSSNAQLDLDLTLRPPGPTAEEIERELSSFLSSFGNRGVTSSVLQNTKIKLQLDVASPAKLLKIRELLRDLQSRPVPAFQARDALLKALARRERDQTRDP